MTTPLAGRVVATTRAHATDDPLDRALEAAGARVVRWPTLAFEGPADPTPLRDALARLHAWDWLVVTSARAVGALPPFSPSRPRRPRVAAVGVATAHALSAAGWPVDVVGDGSGAGPLAATLAQGSAMEGAHVLYPAGTLASDALERALADAGADVVRVEAYRTVARPPDPTLVCADLARGVDVVVFTSPSAVSALADALGGGLRALGRAAVVAIGPTTEDALRAAGCPHVDVARDSDVAGVVDACSTSLAREGGPAAEEERPRLAHHAPGRSEPLMERARRVLPGGVNSPVRAFGAVGGTPRFIASAGGAFLRDVDDRALLDFVGSWGVMVAGHAHPAVQNALVAALGHGTSFGAPTEAEVELAEVIVGMVPGIETVRMVNSGTEATMSALRLARAATGRDRVLKFRGGYHGHADAFLVEAGSGAATLGVPSSPGVPAATAAHTLVAEYNDLASVAGHFEGLGDEIAAVFVEPVAGNMGCVPPADGFLAGLRELCTRHGALLVFDEVMTGFRVAPGGAQELYGIVPDLTTLGKVIGGGLPVGAYGGPADLMRRVAPEGPVYQAGTLSGNPLAMAAGLATLRLLRDREDVFPQLETLGRALDRGFSALAERTGVPLRWNRVGGMGSLFFSGDPVTDWPTASASSRARFGALFHGLLARGVHLPPSPFEAWFWSCAHTEEDVHRTLGAVEDIVGAADFPDA